MAKTIKIQDFSGGWSTADPTVIQDNQLAEATNVYYDQQGILSTRKGIADFGGELVGATNAHSTYSTRLTTGVRILLAAGGEYMYRYNETTEVWDVIQSGLSGEEFSFVTYKDIVYWVNGTDDSTYYDGTTVTPAPLMLKGKYLVVENDVAYLSGVSTDPSSVFYTDANPADLHSTLTALASNDEYVNQDEGIITGLSFLGPILVVGKSNNTGVYTMNIFTSPDVTIEPIDFDGDVASHRSFVNAENDLKFLSTRGVYSLAQRSGTSASYRAFANSDPIRKIINNVLNKDTTASIYYKKTNNVYFAVDQGGGGVNDTLLVYSVLVSEPGRFKYAWTLYENINANDFTSYTDEDGETHLLYADATRNQIVEMETGFADNGASINTKVRTKTFDFESPETWKTFPEVDLGGLISKQETVTFKVNVDQVETSKTFTGEAFAIGDDADELPLGEEPLGEDPLGGGPVSSDGIQFFPFIQRRPLYASGLRIYVQIETNSSNSGLKINKLNVPVESHDSDIFPINNITI